MRWFDVKYGNNEDWHDWVKMHLVCGVRTHVVTGVEISRATKHDARSYKRKDFLAHYHKRSNVESVFQMIKSKLGERLRSKNETAQINEGSDQGFGP